MTEEEYLRQREARIEGIKERFPFVRSICIDGDPYIVTAWFIFGGKCHYGSLEQLEGYCAECRDALMRALFPEADGHRDEIVVAPLAETDRKEKRKP